MLDPRLLPLAASAAVLLVPAVAAPASAGAAAACDAVAAPSGSDSAAGTAAAPFHTVQRLLKTLGPGKTGCLRAGVYAADMTIAGSGQPGKPLTLTSYPGERATIQGRVYVTGTAADVDVDGLLLDGRNASALPSPTVDGTRITFSDDEVTNRHTGICFILGDPVFGQAHDVTIRDSRIHDCGTLPATNHDHGIYVDDAVGTTITGNAIYDNADRGVQLYPDAQSTTVEGNVIDGNGEGVIFSGSASTASSGNVVQDNVIADARIRADIESSWTAGGPVGTGNVARNNCVWGGTMTVDTRSGGFVASGNMVAQPQYVDRADGDLRLVAGSPCADIVQLPAPWAPPAPASTGSGPGSSDPTAPPPHSAIAAGGSDAKGGSGPGATPETTGGQGVASKAPGTRLRVRLVRRRIRIGGAARMRVRAIDLKPGGSARVRVQIRWARGWSTARVARVTATRPAHIAMTPHHSGALHVRACLADAGCTGALTVSVRR